ncbi:Hypothetical_protein [Hexamita inflata]|uniref:Hypothetical_protein n=1 Tax=Hexamita inflata TaxID=28002 RepID=A0ABP1I1T2_9EUKA
MQPDQILMSRITNREKQYQCRVQTKFLDAQQSMMNSIKSRVLNHGNDPVDIAPTVLVYNPHIHASRQFHLRDNVPSPQQVAKRTGILEDLASRSNSRNSNRLTSSLQMKRSVTSPIQQLQSTGSPNILMQNRKFKFDDSPRFLMQLMSPVKQLDGFKVMTSKK